MLVCGFGEQKTPTAFVAACEKFIFTEVLRLKAEEGGAIVKKSCSELKQDATLATLLRNAVEASSDKRGWAHFGSVGSNIAKHSCEYDSRNYGYRKLGELVSGIKLCDMEERQIGGNGSKALYVRDRRRN